MFRICVLLCLILNLSMTVAVADDEPAATLRLDPQRFDLSSVQDHEELAFEESDVYYAILDQVRSVPVARLRKAAAVVHRDRWQQSDRFRQHPENEFPLFYDLTQNPQAYRGQPINLRGHLVRLVKYAAGPNEHGIDTLYEGWLVTPDSQAHPATVICTEIPPGMPIGEDLIDGVSVTGYFFKLNKYSSRDRKFRFAPMILAQGLLWSQPVDAEAGWPISPPLVIGGVLILAIIIVMMTIRSSRRARRSRAARFGESATAPPPDFLNELNP